MFQNFRTIHHQSLWLKVRRSRYAVYNSVQARKWTSTNRMREISSYKRCVIGAQCPPISWEQNFPVIYWPVQRKDLAKVVGPNSTTIIIQFIKRWSKRSIMGCDGVFLSCPVDGTLAFTFGVPVKYGFEHTHRQNTYLPSHAMAHSHIKTIPGDREIIRWFAVPSPKTINQRKKKGRKKNQSLLCLRCWRFLTYFSPAINALIFSAFSKVIKTHSFLLQIFSFFLFILWIFLDEFESPDI